MNQSNELDFRATNKAFVAQIYDGGLEKLHACLLSYVREIWHDKLDRSEEAAAWHITGTWTTTEDKLYISSRPITAFVEDLMNAIDAAAPGEKYLLPIAVSLEKAARTVQIELHVSVAGWPEDRKVSVSI